ncbi:hypothetical protein D210916BOD24_30480 [Alteromonas sp. D210916BOD_24]
MSMEKHTGSVFIKYRAFMSVLNIKARYVVLISEFKRYTGTRFKR